MPCNYKNYPPNWKTEIRPRILARAGNKCELCGAGDGERGYRGKDGKWFSWKYISDLLDFYGIDIFNPGNPLAHCFDKFGNPTKPTKIVLTIAHIHNPDPMDCRDENLKALCQSCHLRHDAKHHAKNARLTRERKAGLQRLF